MAGRKPLYRDLMTWRAIRNALAGLLAGLAGGVLLGPLILIWGVALFTLATGTDDWEHVAVYVGIVLLIMALTPWLVHGLSAMQRSRLRVTLGAEIPAPVRPLGRTWHQLGYHLLAVPAGLAGGLLAVLFPVAPWLARWFTETDEGLARALLGPGRRESLAQRVETLARSRADVVAAADAERRRIERDLHDGAQQRLVSLAMNLGMARERFEAEPEPVRQALAAAHDEAVLALTELREFIRGLHPAVLNDRGLDAALSGLAARAPLPVRLRVDVPEPAAPGVEAVAYFIVSEAIANVVKHAQAKEALVELRNLVRGVHPPVLTERGLDAALSGLAALCPVPVEVHVDVPVRPKSSVEAVAYFMVAEALTNVAKHSRASHAKVVVEGHGYPGTLTLMISDDGIGGADVQSPGLSGLADRVAGVDGRLSVESPSGGPTIIAAELPCG